MSVAGPELSARRMLALVVPAFVVLAAEPAYLLVDTAVVGHLGARALGGLGVGAALMGLLTVVGTFVEYGTTGRAARRFGAGLHDEAIGEGVQATWLALGIGVVCTAVGEAAAGPLVGLLAGGSDATRAAAESWFRIAVLGLPGVLVVLAGNGWMRGVQRNRAPVVIVVAANLLSAVACPLLVYPAGLGLRGSAIANVAAQAVGGALFLVVLRRTGVSLRPDPRTMRAQLVVGRDLVVRAVAFQVAFLTAAAAAARMGTAQIAAHRIGLQLWEFTALLLDAVAIAAQSLVGAALGASDAATARAVSARVGRWGFAAGTVAAVVYAAGWWVIPRLFSPAADVQHQAHILWPWFVGMLPVAGYVFALDGVLIGAGDVGFLRTVTVLAAVVGFAPCNLAALHWHWGLGGIWAGLTAFVLLRAAGMLWRVNGQRWVVAGPGTSLD